MFKKMPIWVFLIVLNGFCLCAGFFLIVTQCITSVTTVTEKQTERNLKIFSNSVKESILERNTEASTLDTYVKSIAGNEKDFRITVVNHDGTVIADSDAKDISILENHLSRQEISNALDNHEGYAIRKSTVSKNDVMYYAIPFTYNDSKAVLRLSIPMEAADFFSHDEIWNIVFWGVVILLIVLASTFLISGFIVSRINVLQEAAKQYQKGNFAFRPLINSPKELKSLGDSFSNMAQTINENISELQRLEQVRTDFVANVSHELKTPVTSIKGFIETLLDGAIDDKETAKHFLEICNTQTARLTDIIEDLLNLSRLESDKQKPDLIEANIESVLQTTVQNFSDRAKDKKISLQFQKLSTTPLVVKLNEGLLSQAVGNIIDNAIKYCPEKSEIVCSLETKNTSNSLGYAVIKIEDNGEGIPDVYKDRIFERFFRVDKSRSRETGGTGLGLSITSHIIKLHGGTIIEKNRSDGKSGACFEIQLPLAQLR